MFPSLERGSKNIHLLFDFIFLYEHKIALKIHGTRKRMQPAHMVFVFVNVRPCKRSCIKICLVSFSETWTSFRIIRVWSDISGWLGGCSPAHWIQPLDTVEEWRQCPPSHCPTASITRTAEAAVREYDVSFWCRQLWLKTCLSKEHGFNQWCSISMRKRWFPPQRCGFLIPSLVSFPSFLGKLLLPLSPEVPEFGVRTDFLNNVLLQDFDKI